MGSGNRNGKIEYYIFIYTDTEQRVTVKNFEYSHTTNSQKKEIERWGRRVGICKVCRWNKIKIKSRVWLHGWT